MSALSRYGLADVVTLRFLARKAPRQLTWTLSQEDVPMLEFWHDDGCRVHRSGTSLAGRRACRYRCASSSAVCHAGDAC